MLMQTMSMQPNDHLLEVRMKCASETRNVNLFHKYFTKLTVSNVLVIYPLINQIEVET